MNYLLDTNVISEFIAKSPNSNIIDWIDGLDPNTVYLSVITIGEIRKGIVKLAPSKRRADLEAWLTHDLRYRFQGRIVEITVEIMLLWGDLVGHMEKEGKPLPAMDSLIAAMALQGNFCLVTRNTADFRDTGVNVVNPWLSE
jgi:toxin FitB